MVPNTEPDGVDMVLALPVKAGSLPPVVGAATPPSTTVVWSPAPPAPPPGAWPVGMGPGWPGRDVGITPVAAGPVAFEDGKGADGDRVWEPPTPPLVCVSVAAVLEPGAPEVGAGTAEDDSPSSGQVRSNRGVVVSSLPMIPKAGSGVTGFASWSVYHHVWTLPNREQPTSSQ